jgi:hypothetical protein
VRFLGRSEWRNEGGDARPRQGLFIVEPEVGTRFYTIRFTLNNLLVFPLDPKGRPKGEYRVTKFTYTNISVIFGTKKNKGGYIDIGEMFKLK